MDSRYNSKAQDRYSTPQSTLQGFEKSRNELSLQGERIGAQDPYRPLASSSSNLKQQPQLQTSVRKAPLNDTKLEGFSASKSQKAVSYTQPEAQKPIEEEFIRNLQQQLYFLEMEIKLTKEQSKERAGKFMGGLEAGPLTENMVVLKSKYSKMQKELEAKVDALSAENRELMSRNGAFQANLQRAVDEKAELTTRLKEDTERFDIDGEKYRKAISSTSFQKEENAKKLSESTKERDLSKTYANETRIKIDRQGTQLSSLEDKAAQAEVFNNKLIEEKNKQLIDLQDKLFKLGEDVKNQSTMTFLQDRMSYLNYQKQDVELDRDNLLNKIKSLKHTKEMIQKASKLAAAEKRDLANLAEDMKNEMEREKTQQDQLLTKRLKEREKRELCIAYQTVEDSRRDSQYHMDNLRIKINENNELIEAKNQMTYDIAETKGKSEVLEQEFQMLKIKSMNLESDLKDMHFKIRIFDDRNKGFVNEIERDVREAKHLAEENQELKGKIEFLLKKVDLNEVLKNIDLEELRTLSKSNVQVNETISMLVNKWENIQGEKF